MPREPEDFSARELRLIARWATPDERLVLARRVAVVVSSYRWQRGLSQQQLADRLGVKQPQVARLESGQINPSIETLLRLCERLGLRFTLEFRTDGLDVSWKMPSEPDTA